jgi:predicted dinucleotide-binding enzyme
MKIGVFGTGGVGRSMGAKLTELGHDVMIGTRNVEKTMARTDSDAYGNPSFSQWREKNRGVRLGTFAEAAAHGELLINATEGAHSMDALQQAGETGLSGKTLMDISNPLDFSNGMLPSLLVCNTDSLAEQIQRSFPGTRVVKTLNTVNARLMADPGTLKDADHTVFMSGNDPGSKTQVAGLLRSIGWKDVIDLGDLTTARGTEMILALWVRLFGVIGTPLFNFKIVR